MSNASFFRPMLAGFAVTATAILVVPMTAKAQAPETARCDAPAPKPHGLRLGRILSAARSSGVDQLLGGGFGGGRGGALVGALASTAMAAAAQTQGDAADHAVPAPCATPAE